MSDCNLPVLVPPSSGKTENYVGYVRTHDPACLSPAELIETSRIYGAVGRLKPGQPLLAVRPFRAPHS